MCETHDSVRQGTIPKNRMSESNRSLALRWMDEVWNQRRDETIDELMAEGAICHLEGQDAVGRDSFRQMRAILLSAFPDLRVEVHDVVEDGNRVVARWTIQATHAGNGLGFRGTGLAVKFRGITWLIFSEGKIVEGWDAWNQGQLMQTLAQASVTPA